MKKYYLIVNPAGGTKKGLKILEIVKPIFDNSGVHVDILLTEYAGHANELANTLNLSGYNGLCAIGGDGTLFEMVNGMLKRKDNQNFPLGLIGVPEMPLCTTSIVWIRWKPLKGLLMEILDLLI